MDVMKELNKLSAYKPKSGLTDEQVSLLAECSIVNGEQTLTEDQVRSMVGAPTREEEEYCICGDKIDECEDAYVHMSSGV